LEIRAISVYGAINTKGPLFAMISTKLHKICVVVLVYLRIPRYLVMEECLGSFVSCPKFHPKPAEYPERICIYHKTGLVSGIKKDGIRGFEAYA
jgi:hypothetical protein